MRELCFEKVPDPEVFPGEHQAELRVESSRENLPDRVREGVVYRDAEVRLRIASEIVASDSDYQNN